MSLTLPRNLVQRLGSSRFNYAFGYVANTALVVWLVSHAWHGACPMSTVSILGHAAAGLIAWTLAEYILHRYVYHEVESFLSVGHDLHHNAPRELIGVPWWLTSILLVGLFKALAQGFAPGPTGVTLGAAWAGYIGYCVLHHGSHHWAMRGAYLRFVKRHHQLHHAYPGTNWGFTTPVWDWVFGTYRAPNRRS